MLLKARVHSADLQDRAAVPLVLEGATEESSRLEHFWADQGYIRAPARSGSRTIFDGASRWSSIRPKRGANGNRTAISMTSQPCGLSGSNSLRSRSGIVAPYQGAG
jgi:hypothetical protein